MKTRLLKFARAYQGILGKHRGKKKGKFPDPNADRKRRKRIRGGMRSEG